MAIQLNSNDLSRLRKATRSWSSCFDDSAVDVDDFGGSEELSAQGRNSGPSTFVVAPGPADRLFACPFYKREPRRFPVGNMEETGYDQCAVTYISDIARLKQHLYRRHKRPDYFCARCYTEFATQRSLAEHGGNTRCQAVNCPWPEKLTENQMANIRRRDPNASATESWYRIYDALFPGSERPASPYVEDEAATAASKFVRYFRAHGPKLLGTALRKVSGVFTDLEDAVLDQATADFVSKLAGSSTGASMITPPATTDSVNPSAEQSNLLVGIYDEVTMFDSPRLDNFQTLTDLAYAGTLRSSGFDASSAVDSGYSSVDVGELEEFNNIIREIKGGINDDIGQTWPVDSTSTEFRPTTPDLGQRPTCCQCSSGRSAHSSRLTVARSHIGSAISDTTDDTSSVLDDGAEPELAQIRDVMVDVVLDEWFQSLLPGGDGAVRSCADAPSPHRSDQSGKRKANPTNLNSRSSKKAKKQSNEDLSDDEAADDQEADEHGDQNDATRKGCKQYLACMYPKQDPVLYGNNAPNQRYRNCAASSFEKLSQYKQHLERVHYMPEYWCTRCYREFKSTNDLAGHARQPPATLCANVDTPVFEDRITDEQVKSLKLDKKKPPTKDVEVYWYEIYDAKFAGSTRPRPASPWFESTMEDHLRRFTHFADHILPQCLPIVTQQLGFTGPLDQEQLRLVFEATIQECRRIFLQNALRPARSGTQRPSAASSSQETAESPVTPEQIPIPLPPPLQPPPFTPPITFQHPPQYPYIHVTPPHSIGQAPPPYFSPQHQAFPRTNEADMIDMPKPFDPNDPQHAPQEEGQFNVVGYYPPGTIDPSLLHYWRSQG